MTATAHVYTSDGFAIAAEGRQRWLHVPSYDAHIRSLESDQVQKLFEIVSEQMTLCYSVKGEIASEDRSFDLIVELGQSVEKLRNGSFNNCRSFAEALAKCTEQAIRDARVQGRLECYPAAEVTIVGFFKGKPVWMDVQFRRTDFPNGRISQVVRHKVKRGRCIVSGSETVRSLVQMDHPLVADFNITIDKKTSLDTATKFATGFIRACCSDWVLQYDPSCRYNGGHIHTAIITPPQTLKSKIRGLFGLATTRHTGFRWVIPPIC
jgi:hypothetical protein